MDIFKLNFFLLIIPCLTSGLNNIKILQSGTAWLGESLTLTARKQSSVSSKSVRWMSSGSTFECDRSCFNTPDVKVTRNNNGSTLWLRNVSWQLSQWRYRDDSNYGKINLEIKVKPNIFMYQNKTCELNVEARCSLPETEIECFQGQNHVQFTENSTRICSDNLSTSTRLTFNVQKSGDLTCKFTIPQLFETNETEQIQCEPPGDGGLPSYAIFIIVIVASIIIIIVIFILIKKKQKNRSYL
ncbi:uncharacterized protein LOC115211991 isoform X1 [Argonauta hians]